MCFHKTPRSFPPAFYSLYIHVVGTESRPHPSNQVKSNFIYNVSVHTAVSNSMCRKRSVLYPTVISLTLEARQSPFEEKPRRRV